MCPVATLKFKYACVSCPECCELMAFAPVGYGQAFEAYDPGPLKCTKNHLRAYKAKDVEIVEFDHQKRLARSS